MKKFQLGLAAMRNPMQMLSKSMATYIMTLVIHIMRMLRIMVTQATLHLNKLERSKDNYWRLCQKKIKPDRNHGAISSLHQLSFFSSPSFYFNLIQVKQCNINIYNIVQVRCALVGKPAKHDPFQTICWVFHHLPGQSWVVSTPLRQCFELCHVWRQELELFLYLQVTWQMYVYKGKKTPSSAHVFLRNWTQSTTVLIRLSADLPSQRCNICTPSITKQTISIPLCALTFWVNYYNLSILLLNPFPICKGRTVGKGLYTCSASSMLIFPQLCNHLIKRHYQY